MGKLNKCGNKLNIIILDACRSDKDNELFKSRAKKTLVHLLSPTTSTFPRDSTGINQHLAVIFACDPGSYSYDGHNSQRNSTFTGVLRNRLIEMSLTLDELMRRVTSDVLRISWGRQRPWMNTCLPEVFSFNPNYGLNENSSSQISILFLLYRKESAHLETTSAFR